MNNQHQAPFIAISIGDIHGIGPEVILKVIDKTDLSQSTPVVVAPVDVIQFYIDTLSLNLSFRVAENSSDLIPEIINILPLEYSVPTLEAEKQSAESGKIAMLSVEKGIELTTIGICDALVTAPISKEAVNLAGYNIPGHTEFLAEKTNTPSVLMMLVNQELRVALVTTHLPIKKVAEEISAERIKEKARLLHHSLKNDFGISSPKIAVFGLNPHAGDGGIIGKEEIDVIIPTLEQICEEGIMAEGPFPADGFFGQKLHEHYDAILAMYHDQGLAPFKLLSFGKGVNFTAGLPIIRTSPDHGTAFDIAGKGIADPSSFNQAYDLALQLAKKQIREF